MKKLMEVTIKAWEDENGEIVIETSNEEETFANHMLSDIELEIIKKVVRVNE